MKIYTKTLVAACILVAASCGPSETKTTAEPAPVVVQQEEEKIWEEFELSATGNTMQDMMFSEKNITVEEGSWVRIELYNEGVDAAMIHNILICNYGTRKEVAMKAIEAGADNQFIPNHKDLVAASDIANPGESVTLEFEAPAKGNYEFFCSYPGHSQMMRGYLFVK
jgi:azurin